MQFGVFNGDRVGDPGFVPLELGDVFFSLFLVGDNVGFEFHAFFSHRYNSLFVKFNRFARERRERSSFVRRIRTDGDPEQNRPFINEQRTDVLAVVAVVNFSLADVDALGAPQIERRRDPEGHVLPGLGDSVGDVPFDVRDELALGEQGSAGNGDAGVPDRLRVVVVVVDDAGILGDDERRQIENEVGRDDRAVLVPGQFVPGNVGSPRDRLKREF